MNKHGKKSQIAIEFMFLVGLAFMLSIIFVISTGTQIKGLNEEREYTLLKDMAFKLQNEVNIAARASEGYSRNFKLDEKLDSIVEYNASIQDSILTMVSKEQSYWVVIPHIEGQLQKGINIIKKQGGVVYLNQ